MEARWVLCDDRGLSMLMASSVYNRYECPLSTRCNALSFNVTVRIFTDPCLPAILTQQNRPATINPKYSNCALLWIMSSCCFFLFEVSHWQSGLRVFMCPTDLPLSDQIRNLDWLRVSWLRETHSISSRPDEHSFGVQDAYACGLLLSTTMSLTAIGLFFLH